MRAVFNTLSPSRFKVLGNSGLLPFVEAVPPRLGQPCA